MQHHPAGSTGPGAGPPPRLAALALLSAYLLFVTWAALRPLDVLWVSPGNVEPLATIRADLERGPEEATRTIGAGLVRLAPLGVLLPLLWQRLGGTRFASLFRTGFLGGMIALALEVGQSFVPSRVADVDTVILNTVGIALAHQLCYSRLRHRLLREPRQGARTPARRRATPPPAAAPERGADPGRAGRARRCWGPARSERRETAALSPRG
ncbi:VanZ family protein [Streptomyces sp. SBT349]|uniref:VanZ family protein n=1 Tax=Streptomyces sp. SBT349 TaxID=1580539 RepID=UPI00069CF6E6|nr:VanZ family protein [Streptomyces sp. SBT349]